ncbi:MAG: glycosyltransferase family 9 protein [Nanoarchaeota archaeon]
MNICIIKLGADGDVLRTLPLAKALYQEKKATITWITKGDIATLLEGLPYIHRIVQLEEVTEIEEESFDALYNFDTEEEALELAEALQATKKYGFHDDSGYPVAYNAGGEYYLNTMFDDELKKSNKKTYQEMMFEVAELPYKKERCELKLKEEDKRYAKEFTEKNNFQGKKIIGIHMGAGNRWPSKAWHPDNVKEFIQLAKSKGYEIIIFGGPNEIEKHNSLIEHLKNQGLHICRNDPHNTKSEFAALVSLCDAFVCSDSFSLHVSIGLGKPTIALFFVTSPAEVETYDLSTKIISPKFKEFFPEKSDVYDESLVKSISAEEVMQAVEKLL